MIIFLGGRLVCRIVYGAVVYVYKMASCGLIHMMICDASAGMKIFYVLVGMMIFGVVVIDMMICAFLEIYMRKPDDGLVVDMKMIDVVLVDDRMMNDVAVFVDTRKSVGAENRMMVFSFGGMMVFDVLACDVFHMMSPGVPHHTDYMILVLVLIIADMKDR